MISIIDNIDKVTIDRNGFIEDIFKTSVISVEEYDTHFINIKTIGEHITSIPYGEVILPTSIDIHDFRDQIFNMFHNPAGNVDFSTLATETTLSQLYGLTLNIDGHLNEIEPNTLNTKNEIEISNGYLLNIQNLAYTNTFPFDISVINGSIQNVSLIQKHGYKESIDNTSFFKLSSLSDLNFPTTDRDLYIVSEGVDDDYISGQGAKTIEIAVETQAGVQSWHTVQLSGTTPVLIANAYRIISIKVTSCGNLWKNQNNIKIGYSSFNPPVDYSEVDSPMFFIPLEMNAETSCLQRIPFGYNGIIYKLSASAVAGNTNTGDATIRIMCRHEASQTLYVLYTIPFTGKYISTFPLSLDKFSNCDIYLEVRGNHASSTVNVQCTVDILLLQNIV